MTELISNYSLKQLNTFGLDVHALWFATFGDDATLIDLLGKCRNTTTQMLILGGGSNMLFTRNFEGVVLKNEIKGISILSDNNGEVLVRAGSGVVWHDFVEWSISNGFGGIENLSLIPGTVGAAPIQNIGAYGVELKDVFHSLECVMIKDGSLLSLNAEECRFGYRDSIFKRELKGKVVITSVTLKLSRRHNLNVSYGAINQELERMGISNPGIRDVSNAVINIRRSKLPDPSKIGNAGSFFKNPEVMEEVYLKLKSDFPQLVAYPFGPSTYKLAAGWLIEQCGWKGKVVGNTGSHKDQALVLVNYGNATGQEVVNLAGKIIDSVKVRFGVTIEPEVNII